MFLHSIRQFVQGQTNLNTNVHTSHGYVLALTPRLPQEPSHQRQQQLASLRLARIHFSVVLTRSTSHLGAMAISRALNKDPRSLIGRPARHCLQNHFSEQILVRKAT